MRLHNTAAPTPLPRQYHHGQMVPVGPSHPLAPQHHRSSEGALTYSGATLLGAASHFNTTRLSLDTKDEYYLNQLRRASQYDGTRSSSILGTVWASYFFISVAILLTFSIVFAVGYYINSMSARQKPSEVVQSTSVSAERILGTKLFDREELLRTGNEQPITASSVLVVEKVRGVLQKPAFSSSPSSNNANLNNGKNKLLGLGDAAHEQSGEKPSSSRFVEFIAADVRQRTVFTYY